MAIVLRKGENKTAAFVSNSLGEMFQFLSLALLARRKLIACQLKSIPYHRTHGSTSSHRDNFI